ncbi:hypothetical protein BD769DRAFT_1389800 [Suillus cothurnatus]|nr:hypothetical protein BD769DRAFT_1389800 [Suillus cothurnatus]
MTPPRVTSTSDHDPSESEPVKSSSDAEADYTGVRLLTHPHPSQALPTSSKARAKHHIAALEDELEMMRQERGGKQRKTTFYIAQGRAIHRLVVLYHSLEDLVAKNDHRYEFHLSMEATAEQNRLQRGYIEFVQGTTMLKKGADAAHSNDTSSLKELVTAWALQVISVGSYSALLIGTGTKTMSGPAFATEHRNTLYLKIPGHCSYMRTIDVTRMILRKAFKAIFTSPSSAREADGDGDGADILENNRCARRKSEQTKVKTCVSSIINMKKVTPRAIAYVVCQVRFALSSVSSWRTVDGDFNYEVFWNNIVDFFKDVPGPATKRKVDKLLEWWTRKIFGTSHREDLTPEVVSQMSVNALAEQRKKLEDAAFDLD